MPQAHAFVHIALSVGSRRQSVDSTILASVSFATFPKRCSLSCSSLRCGRGTRARCVSMRCGHEWALGDAAAAHRPIPLQQMTPSMSKKISLTSDAGPPEEDSAAEADGSVVSGPVPSIDEGGISSRAAMSGVGMPSLGLPLDLHASQVQSAVRPMAEKLDSTQGP